MPDAHSNPLRVAVIQTGSNQDFIFRSSRQRHQIAASHLIAKLGMEDIPQAIRAVAKRHQLEVVEPGDQANRTGLFDSGAVIHAVRASGLGVIVASEAVAVEIIRSVTQSVLAERNDIDVWGAVGTIDVDSTNLANALTEAQQRSEQVRVQRRIPSGRYPDLPFGRRCPYIGGPASTVRREPDGRHVSISHRIDALAKALPSARKRMVELISAAGNTGNATDSAGVANLVNHAVVGEEQLREDGIRHHGWVAYLHADGNGVGALFGGIGRVCPSSSDFLDTSMAVSAAIEESMWTALCSAICHVEESHTPPAGWVLPLIVGGDDVTVIVHGRYAEEFTRRLALAFETEAKNKEIIGTTIERMRDNNVAGVPASLSLGCGLAFVKSHHPSTHAVDLAEELTGNAKALTRETSALDVYVHFESTERSVRTVRDGHTGLTAIGAVTLNQQVTGLPYVGHVDAVRKALSSEEVSRSAIHSIRSAAERGPSAAQATITRLSTLHRTESGDDSNPWTAVLTSADPTGVRPELLTSLDLLDVHEGTVAGVEAETTEQAAR